MLDNLVKFHELEQQLRQLIETRDDFVAVASHELRTPVTALKMQYELNHRKLQKNHKFETHELSSIFQGAGKQIKRLELLLEQILDVDLISRGKISFMPVNTNLVDVVKNCVNEFKINFPSEKIEYECPEEVTGKWDPMRIQQAINNLLSNAVKYGEGKPIRVVVSEGTKAVKIAVTDLGMGIPKVNHQKIFKLYERGISYQNISGLGLGLFLVDQIVKAHHGNIFLKSEVGKGSTFTIELPIG